MSSSTAKRGDVRKFADVYPAIKQRFDQYNPGSGEGDHWQDAFELQLDASQDVQTLLVRGAQLPHEARLMVFDDISEVRTASPGAIFFKSAA